MPRKSKEFLRRSAAAKKGAITRKRNQRREERKRKAVNKKRRDRARAKREIKAEHGKKTYRLTIFKPYFIRKRTRSRKREGSPQGSGLRLTAWFATKEEAIKNRAKLALRAEREVLQIMKHNRHLFRKDAYGSMAIEAIPLVPRQHGKIEVVDEVDETGDQSFTGDDEDEE